MTKKLEQWQQFVTWTLGQHWQDYDFQKLSINLYVIAWALSLLSCAQLQNNSLVWMILFIYKSKIGLYTQLFSYSFFFYHKAQQFPQAIVHKYISFKVDWIAMEEAGSLQVILLY